MVLQLIPRLQNRRMHLLHRVPQLHSEPTQDIPLPRIVLCVHPRLYLLVINHAHPKRLLCLGRVECRASFLDLCKELLPVCEIFAEAVEDVFGFQVPEGLELEPFGDVVSELLNFDLDQGEWSLEGIVREMC